MKKSEKETMKKAFNIPEPERKESFVSLYNQRLKKNERKFNLPVFFRYASTAVFAVLIIGLWGNLSKNADFRDKFNTVEEPMTETVPTTTVTQLTEQNDVTTAKATALQVTQTATDNSATAVQTNKPVQTHAQVTMPAIPDFTPSVTAVTFPTKPETPTRTKPVYTSKAVSATTARKTTVAIPIATTITDHEEESPSLIVTTEQIFPILTESSSPSLDYIENNVTTMAQSPSVDVTPPVVPQVTTENNYEPPSIVEHDYTVYPSAVYNKSDNIIDLSGYFDDTTSQAPTDSVISVDDLISSSDYIILGKVDEIIYTQVNGRPYTQENITVYQVYKGDILHERDRISIYIPGGYMPVSEFERLNNTEISSYGKDYIYISGGNKNHQNIGDIRMFFINDGGKYIPDGAFELTTKNDISIFQARGSEYISSGNNALKFNIKNLLNL